MSSVAAADQPSMDARILDAADRLFYGQGIQAVGVDALAAEAGISKRTLYNHYPSKDALIAAYLTRRASQVVRIDGSPLEQILGVFDRLARWFASAQFRGCPFVNAVAELSGDRDHPAVEVCVAQKAMRREWFEAHARALGVADAPLLADQLVILMEGAIATSLVRGGDPACAHAAQAAARVLLAAAGISQASGAASTPRRRARPG
jgi:AcrR family transcriptional regulator